MDALTLDTFLSPILTVTTVRNTGETGDIDFSALLLLWPTLTYPSREVKTIFDPCSCAEAMGQNSNQYVMRPLCLVESHIR